MTIIVTRPGGGISLNAGRRDVLQDEHGEPLEFEDRAQAIDWLRNRQGWEEEDIDAVSFEPISELYLDQALIALTKLSTNIGEVIALRTGEFAIPTSVWSNLMAADSDARVFLTKMIRS